MNFCPSCGSENIGDASTCASCHAILKPHGRGAPSKFKAAMARGPAPSLGDVSTGTPPPPVSAPTTSAPGTDQPPPAPAHHGSPATATAGGSRNVDGGAARAPGDVPPRASALARTSTTPYSLACASWFIGGPLLSIPALFLALGDRQRIQRAEMTPNPGGTPNQAIVIAGLNLAVYFVVLTVGVSLFVGIGRSGEADAATQAPNDATGAIGLVVDGGAAVDTAPTDEVSPAFRTAPDAGVIDHRAGGADGEAAEPRVGEPPEQGVRAKSWIISIR